VAQLLIIEKLGFFMAHPANALVHIVTINWMERCCSRGKNLDHESSYMVRYCGCYNQPKKLVSRKSTETDEELSQ
jgi:hypothetical protein